MRLREVKLTKDTKICTYSRVSPPEFALRKYLKYSVHENYLCTSLHIFVYTDTLIYVFLY